MPRDMRTLKELDSVGDDSDGVERWAATGQDRGFPVASSR